MRPSTVLFLVIACTTILYGCSEEESNDVPGDANADAGDHDGTDHSDGDDHDQDADDTHTHEVALNFAAVVGTQPLDCATSYSNAIAGHTFALNDLRLFISEISVVDADGNLFPFTMDEGSEWQNDGVALLDFEDGTGSCSNATPATNTMITGSVPHGDFTGLVFTVGVPEALNHVNPVEQTGPLATTALHWSWMMGYKHFQLEGSLDETGLVLLHLGSTECMGSPPSDFTCSISNRPRITLTGADPATTPIVLDLAALLAESTPVENEVFCMAEQSDVCDGLLTPLGLDMATGVTIPGTSASVFRFAE